MINALTPEAEVLLEKNMPLDRLIEKHTMFPYYARFLPQDRRKQALMLMTQGDERYHNLLYLTKSKRIVRHLRYCPLCALEDRERYRETYWHRSHQMIGVDICPWHFCTLKDSAIPISSKPSPSLDSTEEHVLQTEEPVRQADELICQIATYVHEVFQSPVDMDSDVLVGKFFHSKTEHTKYVSPRGEQRNMALLFKDFIAQFGTAQNNTLNAQWKMQKMFCNDRLNTYEVCLVAMFLEITPNELVKMTLPKTSQPEWFDEKIRTLHSKGLKYPEIAKIMEAPYDVVKAIGEGRY